MCSAQAAAPVCCHSFRFYDYSPPFLLPGWYGVIFVRKGHYRGGVFKFVLLIPTLYPDEGPKVHFLSEVRWPTRIASARGCGSWRGGQSLPSPVPSLTDFLLVVLLHSARTRTRRCSTR